LKKVDLLVNLTSTTLDKTTPPTTPRRAAINSPSISCSFLRVMASMPLGSRYTGATVLVTGAGGGIGAEIARMFGAARGLLITQGGHLHMWDPLRAPLRTPSRTPWALSRYRESAIGNAPALGPGPLARLQDLQLLTGLSPQARRGRGSRWLTCTPMKSTAGTAACSGEKQMYGAQRAHLNPLGLFLCTSPRTAYIEYVYYECLVTLLDPPLMAERGACFSPSRPADRGLHHGRGRRGAILRLRRVKRARGAAHACAERTHYNHAVRCAPLQANGSAVLRLQVFCQFRPRAHHVCEMDNSSAGWQKNPALRSLSATYARLGGGNRRRGRRGVGHHRRPDQGG
jgi:hypothetical protein